MVLVALSSFSYSPKNLFLVGFSLPAPHWPQNLVFLGLAHPHRWFQHHQKRVAGMTLVLVVACSCLVAPSGVESRPCCLELVMLGLLLWLVLMTAALLVVLRCLVVGVGSLTS